MLFQHITMSIRKCLSLVLKYDNFILTILQPFLTDIFTNFYIYIYIYIYIHTHTYIYMENNNSCFPSLSPAVWHQKEGGEGSRGSGCDGAGLRGQPDPSEEGGSHRLWRRGGRGEHRGYGHEVHPDSAHGYVQ